MYKNSLFWNIIIFDNSLHYALDISENYSTKVLLPKEFSKVATTSNACRGKCFGGTIFSLKQKL